MTEGAIYLASVRRLPCLLYRGRVVSVCNGMVHAHHAGERPGMGRKASDFTAVPLCAQHHTEWHNASGAFASLDQAQRREWAERAIAATREALAPF